MKMGMGEYMRILYTLKVGLTNSVVYVDGLGFRGSVLATPMIVLLHQNQFFPSQLRLPYLSRILRILGALDPSAIQANRGENHLRNHRMIIT